MKKAVIASQAFVLRVFARLLASKTQIVPLVSVVKMVHVPPLLLEVCVRKKVTCPSHQNFALRDFVSRAIVLEPVMPSSHSALTVINAKRGCVP